jgi:antirestriction protein ArdC
MDTLPIDTNDENEIVNYFLNAPARKDYDEGMETSYRFDGTLGYKEELEQPVLEEALAKEMGVEIIHDMVYTEEATAYWNEPSNKIHMHPKSAYKTLEMYRMILLHELTHSTIIPLKRYLIEGEEEVIAEATATLVGAKLNNKDALDVRHARYIHAAPSQGSEELKIIEYMGGHAIVEKTCLKSAAKYIIQARDYLLQHISKIPVAV